VNSLEKNAYFVDIYSRIMRLHLIGGENRFNHSYSLQDFQHHSALRQWNQALKTRKEHIYNQGAGR